MLRTTANGLSLKIESIVAGFDWDPFRSALGNTRTGISHVAARLNDRLEAIERDFREDRSGFWSLLNCNNEMRRC